MLKDRIIRAWKDPEFRMSLSEEELAELPDHPAGAIELTDRELEQAVGGRSMSSGRPSSSRSSGSSSNHRNVRWPTPETPETEQPNPTRESSNCTWRPPHQRGSVKPRFSR